MVNHPNRSGQSPTAAIRRLLTRHSLQRIEIIATLHGVTARAMPDGFHPIVSKRREDAFAMRGDENITLKAASEIQTASMLSIAQGSGDSLDEALEALKVELTKTAPEKQKAPAG